MRLRKEKLKMLWTCAVKLYEVELSIEKHL